MKTESDFRKELLQFAKDNNFEVEIGKIKIMENEK